MRMLIAVVPALLLTGMTLPAIGSEAAFSAASPAAGLSVRACRSKTGPQASFRGSI